MWMLLLLLSGACSTADTGSASGSGVGGTDDGETGGFGPPDTGSDTGDSTTGETATGDTTGQPTGVDTSETTGDTTGGATGTTAGDTTGGEPPPQEPDIVVDPPEYTFSYLSPLPAMLTRQFTIFNSGTTTLTITAVGMKPGSSPDFGLIGVPPMPKKLLPGDHTIMIGRFLETAGGDGAIVVESDDPDSPVIEVPLESHLKASVGSKDPCVQLVPSGLGFGNVQRGDVKILSAELQNCSTDTPLVLSNITRSSFFFIPLTEEFQIVPMPALPTTIPPGGVLPLDIAYAPLLAGPDIGSFLFHTDDPAEPQSQLDVSGVGTQPPPEELELTIKLSWDTDSTDVDSHLIQPGGSFFDCATDCHFGNPSPDWGIAGDWKDDPFLDVDDVDGFGPEHTNISVPQPGIYKFVVHYYDDTFEDSSSASTNAIVEVFNLGQKIGEFGPVNLDQTNRNWDVFEIEWPSLNITELGNTYVVPQSAVQTCFPGFP
jgi:hypothetical protein